MAEQPTQVSQLLSRWREGDESAVDALMPLVYSELRRLAAGYLRRERVGHTLQPTALVHEAYMRLVDAEVPWQDRVHFFSIAARTMRRVLVDHAKGRRRAKRGGSAIRVTLSDEHASTDEAAVDLLDLDEALSRLGSFDQRKAEIVELHFFGGLTYDETAQAIEVSPTTVFRELRLAKAWLNQQLQSGVANGA